MCVCRNILLPPWAMRGWPQGFHRRRGAEAVHFGSMNGWEIGGLAGWGEGTLWWGGGALKNGHEQKDARYLPTTFCYQSPCIRAWEIEGMDGGWGSPCG